MISSKTSEKGDFKDKSLWTSKKKPSPSENRQNEKRKNVKDVKKKRRCDMAVLHFSMMNISGSSATIL